MKVPVVVLGLMILLAAHPALAQRPHEGPGGPPAGRLLERLIDSCRPACFDTARNCHDTAESDTLASVQSKCGSDIQTAQSMCANNRASQNCQTAVSALRTCAQLSLASLRKAVRMCRDAAETCIDACDSRQNP
jgi:hypothetical protein